MRSDVHTCTAGRVCRHVRPALARHAPRAAACMLFCDLHCMLAGVATGVCGVGPLEAACKPKNAVGDTSAKMCPM